MDVNYELYKVFYFVAKTLSFSEASKQLYISQSAVSQSVKTLERKLEQHLFIRSTKKVQLTPEGEVLFKHVEPAINLIMRGENNLTEAHTLNGGQIRIGASDTICRYFLVPFLKTFHKNYPKIKIKVINQTSLECVSLLENGTVDFIITNSPNSRITEDLTTFKVKPFKDVFIANNDYNQLKEKVLSLKDLKDFPLLMLDQKSTTSDYLNNIFKQQGLELNPEIQLSSNDLLIDLAKIGLGIAFIPDYCLPKHLDNLFVIKLEHEIPPRDLIIAFSQQIPLSAAAKEFIKLIESNSNNTIKKG